MKILGMGASAWAPVAWVLLTGTLVLGQPSTAGALLPELVQQKQFTFTGEVREILMMGEEVWAATGGGLAIHRRSDGMHLRTLTSGDGLPGNSLRSLAQLDSNQVVVGGDFGTAVVDRKGLVAGKPNPIVKLDCQSGCMTFNPVYAIATRPDEILLLRFQGGLQSWTQGQHGSWTRKNTGEDQRPSVWHALATTSAPVFGGLDGQLIFQDASGNERAKFLLSSPVQSLQARPDDVIASTGESLLQVRPDGIRTLVVQDAGMSRSPAASALSRPTQDGTILVGTAQGEVYALAKDILTKVASGFSSRITAVAADGDRLWLGVGRTGLHLVTAGEPPRSLHPEGEICDNHVVGLLRFGDRLVAATFDQGACYLDDQGWHPLLGLPSPMLHGLASDGLELYLATSNGLARFDSRMQPRPFGRRDPSVLRWTAQAAVTAMAPIDDHAMALTSAYGLVEVRREGQSLKATFTSHRAGVPLKLTGVTSWDGEIWVASESQGVKAMGFAGHSPRHLQDPVDLPENWVTAVFAAGPDKLWVGTCQSGVSRVGKKGRQFIDESNLLPDNMVMALAADQRGAFIGTLKGLSFAASQGLSGKNYGWEAGIPDPRSSALLLDGQELWLGTEAGLVSYRIAQAPKE